MKPVCHVSIYPILGHSLLIRDLATILRIIARGRMPCKEESGE